MTGLKPKIDPFRQRTSSKKERDGLSVDGSKLFEFDDVDSSLAAFDFAHIALVSTNMVAYVLLAQPGLKSRLAQSSQESRVAPLVFLSLQN